MFILWTLIKLSELGILFSGTTHTEPLKTLQYPLLQDFMQPTLPTLHPHFPLPSIFNTISLFHIKHKSLLLCETSLRLLTRSHVLFQISINHSHQVLSRGCLLVHISWVLDFKVKKSRAQGWCFHPHKSSMIWRIRSFKENDYLEKENLNLGWQVRAQMHKLLHISS